MKGGPQGKVLELHRRPCLILQFGNGRRGNHGPETVRATGRRPRNAITRALPTTKANATEGKKEDRLRDA